MCADFRRSSILTLFLLLLTAMSPAIAQAQQAAYYVLDGFGGVHAGGGAPAISRGTPYFGFDVARDVAYVPYGVTSRTAGAGILVLDGFGGVHTGGALPGAQANPRTPYFGFDVARAITYLSAPPRAAGSVGGSDMFIAESQSYTVITSATVVAPHDGFLAVIATVDFKCSQPVSGVLQADFGIAVDATNTAAADTYIVRFAPCNDDHVSITKNAAITRLYPVSAGAHTVNLLARTTHSTNLSFLSARLGAVVAVYISHSGDGSS